MVNISEGTNEMKRWNLVGDRSNRRSQSASTSTHMATIGFDSPKNMAAMIGFNYLDQFVKPNSDEP